jgi:hypothetical protein
MSIDRDKITPGRWTTKRADVVQDVAEEPVTVAKCWSSSFAPPADEARANAQRIADLHNADLIMQEMGWGVRRIEGVGPDWDGKWQAVECRAGSVCGINSMIVADDPATAILEAYRWWVERKDGER